MKRNNKSAIALIALSLLALSSGAAFAGHHWGNNDGMWQQGGSPLTTEQQATAQKIYDDYYTQTSALRQQLISKRYEYNALLTASSPDTAKINAVAKEMESLGQKLDEQRVKRMSRWRRLAYHAAQEWAMAVAAAMAAVIIAAAVIWVWETGKACLPNGGFAIRYSIKSFSLAAASDRNLNSPPAKVAILPAPPAMLRSPLPMSGSGGAQCGLLPRNPDPVSAFHLHRWLPYGRRASVPGVV